VVKYTSLLAELKTSYHVSYWDKTINGYKSGTQTAQLLPLYMDIPPTETERANAQKILLANLAATKNTTKSGIIGTAYLLQVLAKIAPETAFAVATVRCTVDGISLCSWMLLDPTLLA
jgi:hypothetical protein